MPTIGHRMLRGIAGYGILIAPFPRDWLDNLRIFS
jgi:RsiW-degrading membrane proteinase PrsW (M82 family)